MKKTAAFLIALAFSNAFAQQGAQPLGQEGAKSLPIADAHFHVMAFMSLPTLVEMMDKHGIKWAGGAGIQGGSPQRVVEVVNALGSRSIGATGQRQWIYGVKAKGGNSALEDAEHPEFKHAYDRMENELKAGARVMGEIHVNALNTAPRDQMRLKVPADSPTLKAMFSLATRYKRPMNVHAQWDADTAASMNRLAESNREGRLILSHCGSTSSASDIRSFFEKNPNVYCDLSFRSPPQVRPKVLDRAIYDSSDLKSAWRQLIEDYPDRFMVGTDDVHNWDDYESVASNIRTGLLAKLTPATAEKVAYKNAVIMFGLE